MHLNHIHPVVLFFNFILTLREYYRFFDENAFFFPKKPKMYLSYIFMKTGLSPKQLITKMISAKKSTNPESFNGF